MFGKLFSKKIDKNQFANLVAIAMKDVGVNVFHYDEEKFAFKLEDGGTCYLENVFINFQAVTPSERDATIQRYIAGVTVREKTPDDFPSAKESLIPIVRSMSYFQLLKLSAQSDGNYKSEDSVPVQPLVGDLVVALAHDSKDSFSIVNGRVFDPWNVNFTTAIDIATDNLAAITDPAALVEESAGVYVGSWGDSYESSRLLLSDVVKLASLDGDPVVCVPSRNTFWVTGNNNLGGLRVILESAEQTHFGAYSLSPDLYILLEGHWQLFVPDDPELRKLLTNIQRRRQALDYGQQKEYLESIYEKEAIDVFVASFTMYEEANSKDMHSICVWSKNVDSMLPRTDRIVLLIDPETKDRVSAGWELALSVVGHLMERDPELIPERYRVRSFPSELEIAELRRRTES